MRLLNKYMNRTFYDFLTLLTSTEKEKVKENHEIFCSSPSEDDSEIKEGSVYNVGLSHDYQSYINSHGSLLILFSVSF